MKRTLKHETHLVELKREIPRMQISQEERLTGGFLAISGTGVEAFALNAANKKCECTTINNCGPNCQCSPTKSSTPTPTNPAASFVSIIF